MHSDALSVSDLYYHKFWRFTEHYSDHCRMSVCQIGIMSIPNGHMSDCNLRPFQMDICQIGIYVHSEWTHMSDWNVRNIFVQVVLSPMLSHQFVVWIVGDPYQFWTII